MLGWRDRAAARLVAARHRRARPASIATRTSSTPSARSPACLLALTRGAIRRRHSRRRRSIWSPRSRQGRWPGRASQLSEDHVAVDVHRRDRRATRDAGRSSASRRPTRARGSPRAGYPRRGTGVRDARRLARTAPLNGTVRTRAIARSCSAAAPSRSTASRRSTRDTFLRDARRARCPARGAPWDALWWTPRDPPGAVRPPSRRCRAGPVPAGARRCGRSSRLRAACGARLSLGARRTTALPLCPARARRLPRAGAAPIELRSGHRGRRLLQPRDDRRLRREPRRARARRSIATCSGNPASSARCCISRPRRPACAATGIGCFYDDPVHDVLGPRAATRSRASITSRSACRSRTRG